MLVHKIFEYSMVYAVNQSLKDILANFTSGKGLGSEFIPYKVDIHLAAMQLDLWSTLYAINSSPHPLPNTFKQAIVMITSPHLDNVAHPIPHRTYC